MSARIDRWLRQVTLTGARRPWVVLTIALGVLAVSWGLATKLRVRGDFVRLLPSDSPTASRFRETLQRKSGGSSTMLVMVEGPDPDANVRIIDALESKLQVLVPKMLRSAEHGPVQTRAFFKEWRWLFAERRDLMVIACEVSRERERRLGMYLDLDDPCEQEVDEELAEEGIEPDKETTDKVATERSGGEGNDDQSAEKDQEKLSPLTRLKRELDERSAEEDRYNTGYYRSDDGTLYALLLRTPTAGMGEFRSDDLFKRVRELSAQVNPKDFHPEAEIGFGGDIPNAIAQREALIEDMTLVSIVAISLILGVIVLFFRSAWPLIHIGVAVGTGCGVAFGTAALAFGSLNAATSFLGSIIVGNGINDSIVYVGRYRECRSLGMTHEEALLDTAKNTRKGTWLASVAAGGAYGALMVTSFRGFSEFGLIGLVGMVTCWFATFGFCPATLTVVNRRRERRATKSEPSTVKAVRGGAVRFIATYATRFATPLLFLTAALAVGAAWPLPGYLADPWEYDFAKLGSRTSAKAGAGLWSKKAGRIFRSRGAPDLVLASSMDEALWVKKKLRERDAVLTGGTYIDRITTVHERLGGTPAEVEAKLAVLAKIREDIDKVKHRLRGEDQQFAEQWRPPERLRRLTPDDLPSLLREQYSEKDGRVGTPVYVYFNRKLSRSKGENLLQMADILESVERSDGSVVHNASRATVFAEMIRSMERDGPRATLVALLVVVLVSLMVTRKLRSALAVIGSLVCGVLFTVGGAAWLGVRLNFLNFVALPLTFGIGVEYAINLYDRIRVADGDIIEGVSSAGGAVLLCSLTTIFGYGSLLWADNLALQSFGKYAVAGEVATILTGLAVMPATLMLVRRLAR